MARRSGFGPLLRRFRRAAELTQEALAERAGYSTVYIGMLERGDRLPLATTATTLADALGLAPDERTALQATLRRTESRSPLSSLSIGSAPPLIGRARELDVLDGHLSHDGSPVLLFAGEPGIGKTRLLYEAARRASDREWTVLSGGCQRRGGQEPYAPLLEALARFVQRQDAERLRAYLHGCNWLARLLPELAEMGVEPLPLWTLQPEQERRLIFNAVMRFLENIAGPAGTLLVLDDLQWSGADALDLLVALARAGTDLPVRIVGAYRSTEVAAGDSLSGALADLVQSGLLARRVLAPLTPAETEQLVARLLPEMAQADGALRDRMIGRTGGVPFFVVSWAQVLRTEPHDGADHDLPWDLAQSLRQRVATLPQTAREALDVVAVAGRSASRSVIVATVGQAEEKTLDALEAACRARLLIEVSTEVYGFAHDVIRDLVAADLSAARRAVLHRRIAQALEREPGDEPVESLAFHYAHGGDLSRAVVYLEQAGDRAQAQSAHAAAEGYYGELAERLDALGRSADAARTREKLGMVLATSARHDAALIVLERAAETYRASNDLDGLARTLALLGRVHAWRGAPDEGIRRIGSLLPALEGPGASHGLAALYTALAHLFWISGRYSELLAIAERGAEMARHVGDDRLLASIEGRRGVALLSVGRFAEALAVLDETIRIAEAAGDDDALCRALTNVGVIYFNHGEFERARVYRERALAAAMRQGDPLAIVRTLANRAEGALYSGDWARSRADLEQALALIRQTGDSEASAYPLLGMAHLSLMEGAWPEMARFAAEATVVAERSGDLQALRWAGMLLAERDLLEGHPQAAADRLAPLLDRPGLQELDVTYIYPLLAWTYLEQGDSAHARKTATQAIARASEQDNRIVLIDALRIAALAAIRDGRWSDAETALDEGLALARRMPYPYAEARLLYALATLHEARGAPNIAREHFDAALAIFHRLGAQALARRTEDVITQLPQRARDRLLGAAISDAQWTRIRALLPAQPNHGRPRADDRRTLEAVLYVQRTGCVWSELPAEFGDDATAHRRFQQWQADGTWDRIAAIVDGA